MFNFQQKKTVLKNKNCKKLTLPDDYTTIYTVLILFLLKKHEILTSKTFNANVSFLNIFDYKQHQFVLESRCTKSSMTSFSHFKSAALFCLLSHHSNYAFETKLPDLW